MLQLPVHPLRIALIPTIAVGGVLGGALITNVAQRLSIPRTHHSLFLRRRPRRRCPRCAGFGVIRCTLCSGEAVVTLSGGRVTRKIPCPMCYMRRHIPCNLCAGLGARAGRGASVRAVFLRLLDLARVPVALASLLPLLLHLPPPGAPSRAPRGDAAREPRDGRGQPRDGRGHLGKPFSPCL